MITHPYDDIEALALGALDDAAARHVLEHADQCRVCSVILAQAMRDVVELEAPGERPLAAGLHLNAAAASAPAGKSSLAGVWRFVALVSATAACLIAIWAITTVRSVRTTAPSVPIAALVHSHFTHHALHGGAGSAKVLQALDGHWLYLVADGLTPDTEYVLAETVDGARREVGTVTTTASGQATGYWEQSPTRISALALGFKNASAVQSPALLRWP